jgi:Protein of unknown function (DUF3160)
MKSRILPLIFLLLLLSITILTMCGCGNRTALENQIAFSNPTQYRKAMGKPSPSDMRYELLFNKELARVGEISLSRFSKQYKIKNSYINKFSFNPLKASFFEQYQKSEFSMNKKELNLYKKNGFVVTGRHKVKSFASMYYKIYSGDLPVFITADSILHAWHRSFDYMLEELEKYYFSKTIDKIFSEMGSLLNKKRVILRKGYLGDQVEEIDLFLTVARSLLNGKIENTIFSTTRGVKKLVGQINSFSKGKIHIFGKNQTMDFSQFRPRGHYTNSALLKRYFKTMMWLARVEVQLWGSSSSSKQVGFAILLTSIFYKTPSFHQWEKVEKFLSLFVGKQDSASLKQIKHVLDLAEITLSKPLTKSKFQKAIDIISNSKLGKQQIRSQVYGKSVDGKNSKLPGTFSMMGQRFALDSWAMSKIVYDNISFKGNKVHRHIPSSLDISFAVFGNNHATIPIKNRISTKGMKQRDGLKYQHNLAAVREVTDKLPPQVWKESIYTHWLSTLRVLSKGTRGKLLPQVIRSKAWALKNINTQLASWTQLRHDTILIVKQSTGGSSLCYYPHGFVEPVTEFWKQMAKMARFAASIYKNNSFVVPEYRSSKQFPLSKRHHRFLLKFAKTIDILSDISKNQLSQQKLTEKEQEILKNVVQISPGSGGKSYNGWYPKLFYKHSRDSDTFDALVTDVHTVPRGKGVSGTLQEGVGLVDFLIIAIDNGKNIITYGGPLLSYYEFFSKGMHRQTDTEWKKTVQKTPPERPEWTRTYLLP